MFNTEMYGYNKEEVDNFIAYLKTEQEKAIMKEKIKVLEAERRVLEVKEKAREIENREQRILTVFETYKKEKADSNKNIDSLRSEQLLMVFEHLQAFMNELNAKYPGVLVNNSYKKIITEIDLILSDSQDKIEENSKLENDPMKALLSKMQAKKKEPKEVKEVKIERNDYKEKVDRPSLIKPVTQMELTENDQYDNLVDKFLNSKPPEEEPRGIKIQSTSFDLKEAVNPKEDLSEIMKAFDFYNNENNDDKPNM